MVGAQFAISATDDTKQAFDSVQRSLGTSDNRIRSIGKGFQLGNILKGVLAGLGVGSAMQIAQTTIEAIVKKRQEDADAIDAVNEESEKQLEIIRKTIALRQNEEEQRENQLKILREQRVELEKQRDLIIDTKKRTFTPAMPPGSAFRTAEENAAAVRPRVRDLTNEEKVAAAKITTQLAEIGFRIDEINVKRDDEISKLREQERLLMQQSRISTLKDVIDKETAAFDLLIEKQKASNDESERMRKEKEQLKKALEAEVESFLRMSDPLRVYEQDLKRVTELEAQGAMTMAQAAKTRDAINKAKIDKQKQMVEDALDEFFGEMDRIKTQEDVMNAAAQDLGFSFASAFENAVISGEKLSNVMRSLAQDVLRVFLRLSVTNPLINSIFGGIKGFDLSPELKFRADGGPVTMGRGYVVGERGPELFVPKSSGNIISNEQMNNVGGGGGGVNITYNIASGVTRAELGPMLEIERRRLKAEIPDMVRRGGAYRAAFA